MFRTAVLSAGLVLLAFLVAGDSASAWDHEIYGNLSFENMSEGDVVVFSVRVMTGPGEGGEYSVVLEVAGSQIGNPSTYTIPENNQHSVAYNLRHNQMIPLCTAGTIHVRIAVTGPGESSATDVVNEAMPCSVAGGGLIPTLPVNPPVSQPVCGFDNDEITIPAAQPEGINPVPADTGWIDNSRTITYSAQPGYQITGQNAFSFLDYGPPCGNTEVYPNPMYQTEMCGNDNDLIMNAQPTGIHVDDPGWNTNERTITLTALPGFQIVGQTEYHFTDAGMCITEPPVSPTQDRVCGMNNDILTPQVQPANVNLYDEGSWYGGMRVISYQPSWNYAFPNNFDGRFYFFDEGDCIAEAPVSPELVLVCGDNNDNLTFIGNPTGIILEDEGTWSNNSRTVSFQLENGYIDPVGFDMSFTFTDEGDCVTEPLVAPLTNAICGDNNDQLFVQSQPGGVELVTSGTWNNNSRTVIYEASAGYYFPEGEDGQFTVTDAGLCETAYIVSPSHKRVCGIDNDIITPQQQHASVVFQSAGPWNNGSYTVVYIPAPGYEFGEGQDGIYTFEDAGICITDPIVEPDTIAACGDNNDQIVLHEQPAGILLTGTPEWQDNTVTIVYEASEGYAFPQGEDGIRNFSDAGLCETLPPVPPVHTMVCGSNNDIVELFDQPGNVIMDSDGSWSENQWTVTFTAAANYKLPADVPAVYNLMDDGPCPTDAPLPPVQTEICGPNNDVVHIPDQPANVMVISDGEWIDNAWSVSYAAAENYVLPGDAEPVIKLVDANDPCPTDAPIPPVQTEVCGPNNDLITIPELQPEGVSLESDSEWSGNERTIVFAIDPAFITEGETEFTFTDANLPCPTDAPIPPVQTQVCGPNNDELTFADTQPEGVSLLSDSGWVEGQRTLSFAIDPAFITEGDTEFIFTDANLPCPTDAPIPPVQTQVCGPNNDELTFADTQPEGVSLASDTDWVDGQRTIVYEVDPAFVVSGETTFQFVDENVPCPTPGIETVTITLSFHTSDGGSLEGTRFVLYAQTAAQISLPEYASGVIAADNTAVIENILPGEYRLVIEADGYVIVDQQINVSAQSSDFVIDVMAMQVPTPEPTTAPTEEPVTSPTPTPADQTPVPTEEPTTTPTSTPAGSEPTAEVISGLPETGSGSGGNSLLIMVGLGVLATLIGTIGWRAIPQRNSQSSNRG